MTLPIYQVDAFADEVFSGNPAAVMPLKAWLPDSLMQNIAMENNVAETEFFVAVLGTAIGREQTSGETDIFPRW